MSKFFDLISLTPTKPQPSVTSCLSDYGHGKEWKQSVENAMAQFEGWERSNTNASEKDKLFKAIASMLDIKGSIDINCVKLMFGILRENKYDYSTENKLALELVFAVFENIEDNGKKKIMSGNMINLVNHCVCLFIWDYLIADPTTVNRPNSSEFLTPTQVFSNIRDYLEPVENKKIQKHKCRIKFVQRFDSLKLLALARKWDDECSNNLNINMKMLLYLLVAQNPPKKRVHCHNESIFKSDAFQKRPPSLYTIIVYLIGISLSTDNYSSTFIVQTNNKRIRLALIHLEKTLSADNGKIITICDCYYGEDTKPEPLTSSSAVDQEDELKDVDDETEEEVDVDMFEDADREVAKEDNNEEADEDGIVERDVEDNNSARRRIDLDDESTILSNSILQNVFDEDSLLDSSSTNDELVYDASFDNKKEKPQKYVPNRKNVAKYKNKNKNKVPRKMFYTDAHTTQKKKQDGNQKDNYYEDNGEDKVADESDDENRLGKLISLADQVEMELGEFMDKTKATEYRGRDVNEAEFRKFEEDTKNRTMYGDNLKEVNTSFLGSLNFALSNNFWEKYLAFDNKQREEFTKFKIVSKHQPTYCILYYYPLRKKLTEDNIAMEEESKFSRLRNCMTNNKKKTKGFAVPHVREVYNEPPSNNKQSSIGVRSHGKKVNDGRRLMCHYESLKAIVSAVDPIIHSIVDMLLMIKPGHQAGGFSLLYSEPGCPQQHLHYDYTQRPLFINQNLRDTLMSYSVIIPLDGDANILLPSISDEKEIEEVCIPLGSILILGGNQKHGGGGYPSSKYPTGNLRLFFFLYHSQWPPLIDHTIPVKDIMQK